MSLETAIDAYNTTPLDGPETPWRAARFIVVDLETTGLDPDDSEIIAFASLDVDDGRVQVASQRMFLVRPEHSAPPESVRIHGLRDADLADAPPIDAMVAELLDALTGRTLVAHAAWVEEGFLRAALGRAGVMLRGPAVDTMAVGAAVLQEPNAQLPLTALAERLSLPVHRPHHADGDALTTAQVFLALATHMEAAGRGALGDLADPGSIATETALAAARLTQRANEASGVSDVTSTSTPSPGPAGAAPMPCRERGW